MHQISFDHKLILYLEICFGLKNEKKLKRKKENLHKILRSLTKEVLLLL